MTVKTLKQILSSYPDGMEVMLAERTTDFGYAPVETVLSKEIPFSEEPGGKELSRETVLVLSDEV